MTSLNPTGSRAGLGKCGQTWGGANSRAKFLAASREWQFVIKCSVFSGPRPHSLQVWIPAGPTLGPISKVARILL